MDTPVSTAPASEGPARSLERLVSELAEVLSSDHALYFMLEPEGAVFSVKAPEVFAFGESIGARWARMRPRERAEAVVDWIRRAAKYCRKPRIVQQFPRDETRLEAAV